MNNAWYARVETTAGGIHLYPLPDIPDGLDDADLEAAYQARADLLVALREAHGIPADWAEHPDRGKPTTYTPAGKLSPPQGNGWDMAVISGPVHPKLAEIATVHTEVP